MCVRRTRVFRFSFRPVFEERRPAPRFVAFLVGSIPPLLKNLYVNLVSRTILPSLSLSLIRKSRTTQISLENNFARIVIFLSFLDRIKYGRE